MPLKIFDELTIEKVFIQDIPMNLGQALYLKTFILHSFPLIPPKSGAHIHFIFTIDPIEWVFKN